MSSLLGAHGGAVELVVEVVLQPIVVHECVVNSITAVAALITGNVAAKVDPIDDGTISWVHLQTDDFGPVHATSFQRPLIAVRT
jgi:hypothetical protein